MKLFIAVLMLSSLSFAMQQDPANMSREMLEQKLQEAQQTISAQQQIIAFQSGTLKLVYDLHYGTPLERANAQADLNKLKLIAYLTSYAKIGK